METRSPARDGDARALPRHAQTPHRRINDAAVMGRLTQTRRDSAPCWSGGPQRPAASVAGSTSNTGIGSHLESGGAQSVTAQSVTAQSGGPHRAAHRSQAAGRLRRTLCAIRRALYRDTPIPTAAIIMAMGSMRLLCGCTRTSPETCLCTHRGGQQLHTHV
ncbi:hypothetical protein EYF80_046567 [Liparis tanakae]|uniref:Uncharacterized protein n=1 Tax=Liparis tanakae TaxID=230148 RepID=A0A4Z2FQH1_9TELE|nr:hypothetical protein EYF80_046567 [Liparis tanakae]